MEVSSSGAACHADVTDRLTESHAVAFLQADANSAQLAVVHGAAEMAIDVFLGPRADHQSVSADAVLNYLQHPSAPPAAHLTAKGCGDVKAMVCLGLTAAESAHAVVARVGLELGHREDALTPATIKAGPRRIDGARHKETGAECQKQQKG